MSEEQINNIVDYRLNETCWPEPFFNLTKKLQHSKFCTSYFSVLNFHRILKDISLTKHNTENVSSLKVLIKIKHKHTLSLTIFYIKKSIWDGRYTFYEKTIQMLWMKRIIKQYFDIKKCLLIIKKKAYIKYIRAYT